MTGWIKMGTSLRRKPQTVRIASALNADRLRVVGGLHAVWCVFDEQSLDGTLVGYTLEVLDQEIGWPGFAEAMEAVGWLIVSDCGISVPSYEEHNGPTAKRRASESKRKAEARASDDGSGPQDGRNLSASDADKKRPRVRVESKKINTPHKPPQGGGRFDEFWTAWPKNERKQDKAKCLEHWKRNGLDELADTIIGDVRSKRGTRKWVEGFIEAPLVYLRGRRWEDGNTEADAVDDEPLGDWRESRASVEAMGERVGVGRWDQRAFELGQGGESFAAYERRVVAAKAAREGVPA